MCVCVCSSSAALEVRVVEVQKIVEGMGEEMLHILLSPDLGILPSTFASQLWIF